MQFTRRHIIKASLGLALTGMMPSLARASLAFAPRRLHFHNTHTGESLKTIYWENGSYQGGALQEIAYVLRDHRNNTVHEIDPRLLDTLSIIHDQMGSKKPFEVISGYRSPESNALLHAHSNGVAKDSMHLYGKAIDIRLTDRRLKDIQDCAISLQEGGVGYYPSSNFVHVDTGAVRQW
jgi:uncharacterized protein YcbK (DUF882 family)